MNRAYSLLEIKALDDEKRIISGMATTPEPDRVGDIVEPLGATYAAEIPFLWQHQHDKPVGVARLGKATRAGIPFTAEFPVINEPGPLKDLVDMAWQSIKAKLVRAVSIGFRAVEYKQLDSGGLRFTKTEIFELSGVTIPANASATISTVKSLDSAMRAATGISAGEGDGFAAPTPGVSGKSAINLKPEKSGVTTMSQTVQEQLDQAKAKLSDLQGKMTGMMTKAADEGTTLDAAEADTYDEIAASATAVEGHIKRLEALVKSMPATAKAVDGSSGAAASASRGGQPVQVKNTQKLEPGIRFARFALCMAKAHGNIMQAQAIGASQYPDDEAVNLRLKAAVEAGTTLDSTYAAPLVRAENFEGDFVEFLRPQTIIGKFGTDGIPGLRRIPFNVRIAGQTSGGQGYWVGEGAPKPLTAFDFNAIELRWAKVANIAVLTEELIRFSNPSAEMLVRQALADALIARLDIDFIDPGKAAVANVSPASITNGVTPVVSSGTDAEAVRTDLKALWAGYIANNINPTGAVYIMSATTALALSLMQNPLGQSEFPGLTMRGGTLLGVPVIVSEYVAGDTTGAMVILANATDIYLADDGGVAIDASREASLQMLDNPTNNSATATGTSVVSMFQTNSVALRAERYINWAKRRPQAVAYLTGVNWA